jgi:outer membrane receptor protein involved in Fe transport
VKLDSKTTTLTVGGRLDHHSVLGTAVSPKAGLNVRVTDNLRLRISWGRGFRAPDLGQLYYRFLNPTSLYQVLGNPDLNPEHSGSWQAGAEYVSRGRRARFGLNLFRNDVRNLINAKSLGFVFTPAQVDAIFAREGLDPTLKSFVVLNRLLFVYQNQAQHCYQRHRSRRRRTLGVSLQIDNTLVVLRELLSPFDL